MPIILCQVFPEFRDEETARRQNQSAQPLYAAAVKGDAQVTWSRPGRCSPTRRVTRNRRRISRPAASQQDRLRKWAAALHPILATLGLLDTEPDDFTPEPGFVSLFNGRDLTGWGFRPTSDADIAPQALAGNDPTPRWPIVTEPVTFDGQTTSSDGRYVAKHGRLVVTTPPEGRKSSSFRPRASFRKISSSSSSSAPRRTPTAGFSSASRSSSAATTRSPGLTRTEALPAAGLERDGGDGDRQRGALHLQRRSPRSSAHVPATGPIGLEGDRGQMEYRHLELKELQ